MSGIENINKENDKKDIGHIKTLCNPLLYNKAIKKLKNPIIE
jgi:phosphoribosylformylglycinamidine (FGAM) synthase PurS component